MKDITITYWKSPVGELMLGSFKNELCLCDWRYRKKRQVIDLRIQKELNAKYVEGTSAILLETINQLKEYFQKQRMSFDIPVRMVGSSFQYSVWKELQGVKYGETETYLGLAKKMKNENAIRAVAAANGANAISILIPCHRIIGSDNRLIGYAGGLVAKKKLLDLEGAIDKSQLTLFE